MKFSILFTTMIFIAVIAGCGGGGGGGDDGDAVIPPANGGTGGGGDGGGDGGEVGSTETILKADTVTANAGVATSTGNFNVPGAGTVRSVVIWFGPPAQLVSFFKKSGNPETLGWASGGPEFQGTFHVSAAGTYTFYISNSVGPTTNVSYIIYFTPD